LDVDVLAGGDGVEGHGGVPVIGRADEDGVDVLAVEDILVTLGGGRPGVGELEAVGEGAVVDVADGDDLDVGDRGQRVQEWPAAPARTDAADTDGVAGP